MFLFSNNIKVWKLVMLSSVLSTQEAPKWDGQNVKIV